MGRPSKKRLSLRRVDRDSTVSYLGSCVHRIERAIVRYVHLTLLQVQLLALLDALYRRKNCNAALTDCYCLWQCMHAWYMVSWINTIIKHCMQGHDFIARDNLLSQPSCQCAALTHSNTQSLGLKKHCMVTYLPNSLPYMHIYCFKGCRIEER